jgi:hypothetical protein
VCPRDRVPHCCCKRDTDAMAQPRLPPSSRCPAISFSTKRRVLDPGSSRSASPTAGKILCRLAERKNPQ